MYVGSKAQAFGGTFGRNVLLTIFACDYMVLHVIMYGFACDYMALHVIMYGFACDHVWLCM